MKLTTREKRLLAVLLAAILVLGYYKLILEPQRIRIQELSMKKEEYGKIIEQMKKDISAFDQLDNDLKNLNAKISFLTQKLYPSIFQEKIIIMLDEQIKISDLTAKSITFSDLTINLIKNQQDQTIEQQESSLRQFVQIYQDAANIIKNRELPQPEENKPQQEEKSSLSRDVEQMSAAIDFTGTYRMLMNFIKEVEGSDKITPIKSLEIRKVEESDLLEGNINLEYYAVPKLNMQDEEYYRWEVQNTYGKENPFDLFSGYINPSSLIKYDFAMTLNSYSSGLPTVIMGKNMESANSSYIYAISQGNEDVELQILQEGNQYYYKYRAGYESLPQDYENEMVEFKPFGKRIEFMINSRKRVNSNDNSGINLSLVNMSDLTLQVTVDKDDFQNPRVTIDREQGSIVIK